VASLRSYNGFFVKALQAHLAYGGSLFVSLVASATQFVITVMIWNYAQKGRQVPPGFYPYLIMGSVLTFSFNVFLERSIGERIREGLVATDLLKPVDFQGFYMVQALSDVFFQALIAMAMWLVGLAVMGREMLPASPAAFGLFSLSFLLAFFVQYAVCFIFVQGIFLTNANYGIFASRVALHQAFSGAFAPITMYPAAFLAVASCLPFRHVVYTPAAIYLGWIQGPEAWTLLLEQALWAIGLTILGRICFRAILSKIAIQGG
jgi:ABC-2 type transport system permease protein